MKIPYINEVLYTGEVSEEPQYISCKNGMEILKFRLKTESYCKSCKDSTKILYVTVKTVRRNMGFYKRNLSVGTPIQIIGKIDYDKWMDKETGEKKGGICIYAKRILLMEKTQVGDPNEDFNALDTEDISNEFHADPSDQDSEF